ncbi:MAG TPA: TetR family transcriptional regulator [Rubrivivax sp.]
MARKTKEDALATRSGILDAAEHLFHAKGVAGTSLQEIALAAGVTRGAVYWHFQDKSDVFNAMMDRVCLPMEESSTILGKDDAASALTLLRTQMLEIFAHVTSDPQVRRVFDIAKHKVEYVGEMDAVRTRHLQIRHDYSALLERALRRGQRSGEIVAAPSARHIAIGLHALLDGLIQNWLLDPDAFDLRTIGRQAVDVHLAGLTRRAR